MFFPPKNYISVSGEPDIGYESSSGECFIVTIYHVSGHRHKPQKKSGITESNGPDLAKTHKQTSNIS
jgi:hypothetical protein